MSKDCKYPESHICLGPLFLVKHNNKEIVYCSESIKGLIKLGHGVSIIEKVPRKSILSDGKDKYDRLDHFFD